MPTSAVAEISKDSFERNALKHEVEAVNHNINRLIEVLTDVMNKPLHTERQEIESLVTALTNALNNPPKAADRQVKSGLEKLKDQVRKADWFVTWAAAYNTESVEKWLNSNLDGYCSQPWLNEGETGDAVERARVLLQHGSWKKNLVPDSHTGTEPTYLNLAVKPLPNIDPILARYFPGQR